jgi:hypothetical protein
MPVTLAQAKLNATDDVDVTVIDEFRKKSAILDALTFDDVVNPAGGGATLTYGYQRQITQGTAAFRAINAEYTPGEVTKQRYTVDLKPLGGSFQIDRVLANIGARNAEVGFQLREKIKATVTKFQDAAINGDTDVDSNGFDGLNKALRGTATEYRADAITDWTAIDTKADALAAIQAIDEWLGLMDGQPDAIFGNKSALAWFRMIASYAELITRDSNEFGMQTVKYGNITLIDPGEVAGSSAQIIPVRTVDPDSTVYTMSVTGSPAGGTFSLTVTFDGDAQETTALAYNADAATVQAALIALSNVPAGGVTVTGTSTKTVTFLGALQDTVVTLALTDNDLTGGTTPSVTVTESATTTNYTGTTDLYAVRFGLDGFHGVSMAGSPLVQTWLPDFSTAGAVKTGEVEMGPVAVVLKATKAAAVYRNIKVAA